MSVHSRDGQRPVCLLFATSGHSGVDRVVANLLPALARTGRPFDLLLIRRHGPYPPDLPNNVRLRRIPVSHRALVPLFLVPYLRRARPAAVLTAGHPLNRAAVLSRMLARVDTRVVLRFGMSMEGKADRLGPRRYRRFVRSLRRWYAHAARVIVPSKGVADSLAAVARLPAGRVCTIHNPIVDDGLAAAATAQLDDAWFASGAPPVILAAGSLESRKDFATLLRAFARLRTERPARLVILGRGPEHDRLVQLADELGVSVDVRFVGFDPNPYRWMARAAAFVLCSRQEGSGAVLVEALACATPVVATDCPSGPAEILQYGRVGPLVPVNDSPALAEGIRGVLDDPVDSKVLRAAVEPYRVERAAGAYLEALGVDTDGC